jgi:hypothetical protein
VLELEANAALIGFHGDLRFAAAHGPPGGWSQNSSTRRVEEGGNRLQQRVAHFSANASALHCNSSHAHVLCQKTDDPKSKQ